MEAIGITLLAVGFAYCSVMAYVWWKKRGARKAAELKDSAISYEQRLVENAETLAKEELEKIKSLPKNAGQMIGWRKK